VSDLLKEYINLYDSQVCFYKIKREEITHTNDVIPGEKVFMKNENLRDSQYFDVVLSSQYPSID